MKTVYSFSIMMGVLLLSCNSTPDDTNAYEEVDQEGWTEPVMNEADFPSDQIPSTDNSGVKIHSFRDEQTGLIVKNSAYPSSWKVISRAVYTFDQKIPEFLAQIQGPNGLQYFNTPITAYMAFDTYANAQQFIQGGLVPAASVSSEMGVPQILEAEVKPRMEKSGFVLVNEINRPVMRQYFDRKLQETGGGVRAEMRFFEFTNNKGKSGLATITKVALPPTSSVTATFYYWFYNVEYTFADQQSFGSSLEIFEKVALGTQDTPEWQQYINALQQQRMQIAQQQIIAGRQAREYAFNSHQNKMKAIWAAQDANHAAFMNKNFGSGSNTSQQRFLNMIREEETVYNPLSGKNYQVNSGYRNYWMDSDGHYVQSNDAYYTPQGDINLNHKEWVKVNPQF